MKGLLLKDWYMTKKYFRMYLLIVIIFIAASLWSDENMFLVFYPCLLCGLIPVNLLGYDERSRWTQYSGALPYTKAQIVSSKYLIGLLAEIVIIAVTGISQIIRMSMNGGFSGHGFAVLMMRMFISAVISPAFCLPFIFKYGAEKGRMAYYLTVGFVCAVVFIMVGVSRASLQFEIRSDLVLILSCIIGIIIYALSWCLSVVFYKKREI